MVYSHQLYNYVSMIIFYAYQFSFKLLFQM